MFGYKKYIVVTLTCGEYLIEMVTMNIEQFLKFYLRVTQELTHRRETLKDKYLTWRTSKDKITRDWEKWIDATIVRRATTVENYYTNFRYIVQLDPNKVWDMSNPFGWVPVKEFKQ